MGQTKKDFSLFKARRKELVAAIRQERGDVACGAVLLFAGFESSHQRFHQESSFFYYTGIKEPGLAILIDLSGRATVFVPQFQEQRQKWHLAENVSVDNCAAWGVDDIQFLGDACAGYQISPDAPGNYFKGLRAAIEAIVRADGVVFVPLPGSGHYSYSFGGQHTIVSFLYKSIEGFSEATVDLHPFIARQRQIKDMHEVEELYRAAEVTCMAQEAAAQAITDGVLECEVQASLEYIFTAAGSRSAFASVVASGERSTVLHYAANQEKMRSGDLVVIDIGACDNGYCADITRTYPVSGRFSKRQKEVYNLVLSVQEYIAGIAKPGYWIRNNECPEKSLHHLAVNFFSEKGYGEYFTHGIGHYLGLDVHDVGDYTQPLAEGMVFTIEPGIYIPKERIGIRIEDNYWVVKDGVVSLSEQLPKKAEEIEAFMRGEYEQPEDPDDFCADDCSCDEDCEQDCSADC